MATGLDTNYLSELLGQLNSLQGNYATGNAQNYNNYNNALFTNWLQNAAGGGNNMSDAAHTMANANSYAITTPTGSTKRDQLRLADREKLQLQYYNTLMGAYRPQNLPDLSGLLNYQKPQQQAASAPSGSGGTIITGNPNDWSGNATTNSNAYYGGTHDLLTGYNTGVSTAGQQFNANQLYEANNKKKDDEATKLYKELYPAVKGIWR